VRIRQLYGVFVLNSWCGGLLLLLAVVARAELTDETQTTPNVPAEGGTVAEVATGHPFVPPTGLALSSDGKRISVASTDDVRATVQPSANPVPMAAGTSYPLGFDVSNGDQRAYLLYLPAGYNDARSPPYPLVAMFHGLGGSAFGFAAMLATTGLRTLADTQGKIIVFFQGTLGQTITAPGWWNMTNVGRDDVLYTQELLDYLAGEINVDVTRVFAAGHSLGGRFVHELGTRDPERFRAIADVSGFYGTTIGQPAAPPAGTLLPVLIVHGALDLTVPLGGGFGALLPNVNFQPTQFTYNSWYANNGCTEPTMQLLSIAWYIQRTDCTASRLVRAVEFVSVANLDHHWPVVPGDLYDASSEMLAFFDLQ
jgi:poly(3-hydroxybutyrate) depolymerase